MSGYIRIYRDIREHWIYSDPEHLKIWIEILCVARFEDEPKTESFAGMLFTQNKGEFVYGRKSWSKRLGIGEQKIRTFMEKMVTTDTIFLVKKFAKFSIYSVKNYDKYNQHNNHLENLVRQYKQEIQNHQKNHQKNHQVTTKEPPSNHQVTTYKNGKNGKNGNKNTIGQKASGDLKKMIIEYSKDDIRLQDAINNFIQHRKDIGKPIKSLNTLCLILKELTKHSDKIEVINQSIINGWQGLFELRKTPIQKNSKKQTHENFDQREYGEGELEKHYINPCEDLREEEQ